VHFLKITLFSPGPKNRSEQLLAIGLERDHQWRSLDFAVNWSIIEAAVSEQLAVDEA